jgi:hypothetical protein
VRVVAKALAREPAQRYQTADEFARDLSVVLVGLGRPVTYTDIAELVRQAAAERDRRRKATGKDAAGVIGDLIIDTLHDFSGGVVEKPTAAEPAVVVRGSGFEDPSSWGLEALFEETMPARPAPAPAKPAAATPAAAKPAAATSAAATSAAGKPAAGKPAAAKPAAGKPAAGKPAAKPSQAEPTPPPPRTRMQEAPEKKEGPFWRRWFGS